MEELRIEIYQEYDYVPEPKSETPEPRGVTVISIYGEEDETQDV